MTRSATKALEIREPQQARGRKRFERILAEAEDLLLEKGVQGFSIPELAKRLSYTRTSIYHFFSTPHAILNELMRRYLIELEAEFQKANKKAPYLIWQQIVEMMAEKVTLFYNSHPVGRMLILGESVSQESHKALASTLQKLSDQLEFMLRAFGIDAPSSEPNVPAIAVEIGTACLRLCYHLHGEVTPVYQRECARIMISYLQNYANAATPDQGSTDGKKIEQ